MQSRYTRSGVFVKSMRVLLGISLLFIVLSAQTQDAPPVDPQATEIVTDIPPIIETVATDVPTEVPPTEVIPTEAPPTEIIPTEEVSLPTQDVTPAPTEVTALPTQEITAVPTEITAVPSEVSPTEAATVAAPVDLLLAFSANFDGAYPSDLSANTSWITVSVADGKALQANLGAVPVSYNAATFTDAAVEAKFLLNVGEGQVSLRGYSAGLNTDGTVTLYHNQVAVLSSTVALTAGQWSLLRLQVVGGEIQVSINGVVVIDTTDATATEAGIAGFAVSSGAIVRVDNFAVYGIPTGGAVPTPIVIVLPVDKSASDSGPLPGAPEAPSLGASYDLPDSIHVQWTDVDGEDGYVLESSSDNMTWSTLTSPAADETSYDITGLSCGVTIYLRIASFSNTPSYEQSDYSLVAGKTAPCTQIVLNMPANAAFLNPSTLSLSWFEMLNMTDYEIDIASATTFAAGTHVPGYPKTVSNLSDTPPTLSNGLYYWHVRAKLPVTSPFSLTRTFTVDTMPPAVTVLALPANLAVTPLVKPVLSWIAVPDVPQTKYDLEVDNDSDFSSPIAMASTNLIATAFTLPVPLDQGVYYWHVKSRDAAGNESPFSNPISFTVNPMLTPANNAMVTSATFAVTFKWTPAPGTSLYTVQLDTPGGDFSSPLAETCTSNVATIATCTVFGIGPGGYIWRVVRDTETPVSIVSNKFYINQTIPRAPRQTLPANGAVIPSYDTDINASWDWGSPTAPEPAGGPFTYDMEISTSSTFTTIPVRTEVNTSPLGTHLGPLDHGTYFWRVRAVNLAGLPGAWSAGFKVIVDTPLGTPTILTVGPLAAGTLNQVSPRPTVTWTKVANAATYKVRFVMVGDPCDTGGPVFIGTPVTALTYTIPATNRGLTQGPYDVCVQAFDASGNANVFSAPRTINVFIGTAPANKAFVLDTVKPVFTWTAAPMPAPTPTTYTLVIDDDADFSSPTVNQTVGAVTSLTLAAPLDSGTYYWRVERADEALSLPPSNQPARTLYVGLMDTPDITAPSANALVNGTSVDTTWDAATPFGTSSITHYEWQISKTATMVIPLVASAIEPELGTGNHHTFTLAPLQNGVKYYWRVRGLDNGVPVTGWRSSSFIVDNVVPAVPVVTSPVANVIFDSVRPKFTWTAVPTAKSYMVSITQTTPGDILPPTPVTGTSFTPSDNLPQDTLTFTIAATDGINTSDPKNVSFKVRLGTLPALNGAVTTRTPTFKWTAVPDATSYTLDVADGLGFSVSQVLAPSSTSYTLNIGQSLPGNGIYYWTLSHDGENGGLPTISNRRMFTFNQALAKPTNLLVLNDDSTVDSFLSAYDDSNFTLEWDSVPNAGSYEVTVATNATFTTGVTTYYPTAAFQSFAHGDLVDGVKFWRVRAVYGSSGVGPFSTNATFMLDTVPLSAPTTTLADGVTFSSARPTFTWDATTGTPKAYYMITILDNGASTAVDHLFITTTSYTLPPAVAALGQDTSGRYTWEIESIDFVGNSSTGFTPRSFNIFSGLLPSAGQALADTTPTFTWTPVAGNTSPWTVQIATDAAMTSPVTLTGNTVGAAIATYTVPNANALTPGLYFWRVLRATDNPTAVNGRPFLVVSTLADVTPVFTTPDKPLINADQLSGSTALNWSFYMQQPEMQFNYIFRVQIATAATFAPATVILDQNVPTIYIPTSLPDKTYYWRVKELFGPSNEVTGAPFSAVRSFTVDTTPPGVPNLMLPINSARITTTRTPVISWSASVPAAAKYTLEVAMDNAFTTPVFSVTTTTPTYTVTPPKALANGTYYWRVSARDAAGNLSAPSSVRSFQIALP